MSADERRAHGDARPTPPPVTLQDLLDDMLELRLTLAADLNAAAGAAEARADQIVSDILIAEQRELAGFARRSRIRLASLSAAFDAPSTPAIPAPHAEAPVATPSRWRRRALVALPAIPMVGALAVSAAAAAGLLPLPSTHTHAPVVRPEAAPNLTAPVALSFHELETIVKSDPSASQVMAAATALHHQLEQLIANSPHDAAGANEIAQVLQMEQALLMRTQPPGTAKVLAESRQLAARLGSLVAAAQLNGSGPSPTDVKPPTRSTRHSSPKPGSSASPTASSTTSGGATTAPASAPSSTPTSSPSPSSTDSGHLPTIGN